MPIVVPNSTPFAQTSPAEDALIKRARAIHEKVINLDTHIDFEPANLTGERNYTQRLETQFNLPNMIDGGLDALFFSIYVGQTREAQNPDAFTSAGYERAYKLAVEKFDAVQRFYPRDRSGQDRARAHRRRRSPNPREEVRKSLSSASRTAIRSARKSPASRNFTIAARRYLSLTHNGHNQLADSHTGERDGWKWNGLSPLGKQVVAEIESPRHHDRRRARVKRIDDASRRAVEGADHRIPLRRPSALRRAAATWTTSSLLALKKSGGVIQVFAYSGFIKTTKPDTAERSAALATAKRVQPAPTATGPGQRARFQAAFEATAGRATARNTKRNSLEIDKEYPGDPPVTLKDFVDHIDYAVKLIGIDHVGISSDFDGGGGVIGWNDAERDLQRDFRTRPTRLYGTANRKTLGRQPRCGSWTESNASRENSKVSLTRSGALAQRADDTGGG